LLIFIWPRIGFINPCPGICYGIFIKSKYRLYLIIIVVVKYFCSFGRMTPFSSRALGCCLLCFCFLFPAVQAQQQPEEAWSVKLLKDVIQNNAPQGTTGDHTPEGLILRTYQLHRLRVGEGGKGRAALQLLEKLLPAGSTLKLDAPSNSLHLLATPSAQAAAWEFISTVDAEEQASVPQVQSPEPSEVRELLQHLRKAPSYSPQLERSIEGVHEEMAALNENTLQRQYLLIFSATAIMLLLVASYWFFSRRRVASPAITAPSGTANQGSFSLLAPDHVSSALEPVQRQMHQEMLGALNAAAIRMESWSNEQKSHREELSLLSKNQEQRLEELRGKILDENRAVIEAGGRRFEASATRIEDGVARLGEQNDKIAALARELERTSRELDSSKDQIIRLQSEMSGRGAELDKARQALHVRETDLSRQQAKIAALSLILEKGAGLPELRFNEQVSGASSNTSAAESVGPDATGLKFQFLPP
jgi:hypothetical protein